MGEVVAVIGASSNRAKYGNRAVRAFQRQGFDVKPVNPNEREIEGLPVYRSIKDVRGPIDRATLYVPPDVGLALIDEIAACKPGSIWLNPGAESPALVARARALGYEPVMACSILAIGERP